MDEIVKLASPPPGPQAERRAVTFGISMRMTRQIHKELRDGNTARHARSTMMDAADPNSSRPSSTVIPAVASSDPVD